MANSAEVDKSIYFVPESGWYPVFLAFGLMLTVTGLAGWLNDVSAGRELESGFARLQEAALELSLPVVRISGLALPECEATGGGALSDAITLNYSFKATQCQLIPTYIYILLL